MPEALTWQPTQHIQNSAQNANVTKNLREHIQNSAQTTNVPNNQTEHIQNSAQDTNVKKLLQNTFQTVHEKLPYQTIIRTHSKRRAKH